MNSRTVGGARLGAAGLAWPLGVMITGILTVGYDLGTYRGPSPQEVPLISGEIGRTEPILIGLIAVGAIVGSLLPRRRFIVPVGAALTGVAWVLVASAADPELLWAGLGVGVVGSVASLVAMWSRDYELEVVMWASTGIVTSAAVFAFIPDVGWSTVCGVGGAMSIAGAIGLSGLPAPTERRRGTIDAVAVLSAIAFGAASAPAIHAREWLRTEWQAGFRYHLAVLAVAACVVGAGAVWERYSPTVARGWPRLNAELLAVVGITGMLASRNLTLPGEILTVGLIAGIGAAVSLGWSRRKGSVTPVLAFVAAAIGTGLGIGLLDDQVHPRSVIALCAATPLLIGVAFLWATVPRRVRAEASGEEREASTDLVVTDIDAHYGGIQALYGVTVRVRAGTVTALLGANGAGKTTLLNCISGLHRPSRGSVNWAGIECSDLSPSERVVLGICSVGSGNVVAPDLSVTENLLMFASTVTGPRAERFRDVFEAFPVLNERREQRAGSLSGGERQMLALAKAFVQRPRVLLIDEVSLGLAPVVLQQLVPALHRLKDAGMTIFLVEQNVAVALELADYAYCLERGRIVFDGTSETLSAKPELLEAVYLEGVDAAIGGENS